MKLPWSKKEVRAEPVDYAESMAAQSQKRHRGDPLKSECLAVIEAAAGFCGRTLAGCMVTGYDIPPMVMEWIGRSLVLRGNACIYPMNGQLQTVAIYDVRGGLDPASWSYRLDLAGPDRSQTLHVYHDQLVHVRTGCQPITPWHGRPAWKTASLSGEAAAALERAVADVMQIPGFVTVPIDARLKAISGLTPEQWSQLADARRRDMENSNLLFQVIEGTSAGSMSGTLTRPDAATGTVQMKRELRAELSMAIGVPAPLMSGDATGPAAREAMRTFEHEWLLPVTKIIAAEFSRVTGRQVQIATSPRFGGEIQAKARALKTLTDAGMTADVAREIVGL